MNILKFLIPLLFIPSIALAQSSGGFVPNQVLTASELNTALSAKVDYSSPLGTSAFVNIGTSGATIPLLNGINTWSATQTYNSPIITAASTPGAAGLNLPQGSAPTSPNNGDIWTTSTGVGVRIAGATDTIATLAATQTLTNKTLTSPILITPALGTPSALVLTNATGLVPSTGTTATGTPSSTTFLRGDNTWAVPPGSGSGCTLPGVANAPLYDNGSGSCLGVTPGAAGTVLTSNGSGSAPTYQAVGGGSGRLVKLGTLSANMNSASDQAITLTCSTSMCAVTSAIFYNCSTSGVATGAFYTAASKGGTTLFNGTTSTTFVIAGASPSAVMAAGSSSLGQASGRTITVSSGSPVTIYLSLTTTNGSALTCSLAVMGTDIS